MIFRRLLKKLAKLFNQYRIDNDTSPTNQTLAFMYNITVGTIKNQFRDADIKQEKLNCSILMFEYLEKIAEDKSNECTVKMLLQVKETVKLKKAEMERIRGKKNIAPGNYDGFLQACCNVIDRTLDLYYLSGLKDVPEADVDKDPRFILESHLLDYLIEVEIQKELKMCYKSFYSRLTALWNWGGLEDVLAEKLSMRVRGLIFTLHTNLRRVKKDEPRYFSIVESTIETALLQERKQYEAVKQTTSLLTPLLKEAQKKIHELPNYKEIQRSMEEEKHKRKEEAASDLSNEISKLYQDTTYEIVDEFDDSDEDSDEYSDDDPSSYASSAASAGAASAAASAGAASPAASAGAASAAVSAGAASSAASAGAGAEAGGSAAAAAEAGGSAAAAAEAGGSAAAGGSVVAAAEASTSGRSDQASAASAGADSGAPGSAAAVSGAPGSAAPQALSDSGSSLPSASPVEASAASPAAPASPGSAGAQVPSPPRKQPKIDTPPVVLSPAPKPSVMRHAGWHGGNTHHGGKSVKGEKPKKPKA